MPNTFSPPSWREDQPWSIEQGLANSLAARSPNLAETMLTRYGMERQGNQAAYHDYMRTINALQQQNMQFNQDELKSKNAIEIGKLAGTHSGGAAFAQGNPYLQDAAQGDMSGLESGAAALQAAKEIHDRGLGFGGMAAGGVAPTSAQIGAIIPQAAGMQVNPPSVVQAAQINADSRRDAAAIGAGAAGRVTQHATVPATADSAGGSVSGRRLQGETYEDAEKRLLNQGTPRTLGENGARARDVGNLLPQAKRDTPVTNVPPNLQGPIPGTQPQSRAASPTPAQAQETANRTVAQWHQSVGNPELKQRAREVYEFSVANGKGGVPILSPELHNGRPAVLGRGGTAYTLQ